MSGAPTVGYVGSTIFVGSPALVRAAMEREAAALGQYRSSAEGRRMRSAYRHRQLARRRRRNR